MPVHQKSGEHLRELIDGRRGEMRVRSESSREELTEDQRPVIVDHRIALIQRDCGSSVLLLDRGDATRGVVERHGPGNLLEIVAALSERAAQPVWVGVEILEGHGFRTEMAAAQGIVVISPDLRDAIAVRLDDEPAHRFAQMTRAMVRPAHPRILPDRAVSVSRRSTCAPDLELGALPLEKTPLRLGCGTGERAIEQRTAAR